MLPSPRPRKTFASPAATVIAVALVAACGGGDDDAPANLESAKSAVTPSLQAVTEAATADFTIAWSNEPGGIDVALDAADNVYTATWVQGPGGDIALTKRSAAGTVQWTRGFDNTDATRFEAASGVTTDGAGNAYVSGTIRSGFSNPVNVNSVLMKFASDGTLLWRQVYGDPFDGSSTRRVLADAAGNAYVLGLNMSPTPGLVSSVRKFNPDGSTAWTWFDLLGVVGNPFDLKWGRDGRLLVTGGAPVRGGYSTIDPATGLLQSGGFVSSSGGMDIATDAQGNLYATYTNPSGTGGVLRHAGNPFGGLWERALEMSAFRVETDGAGNAIVSGFPVGGQGGAAFMKFAPDGTQLWSNQDADGPGVAMLAHARMRLDAAGNAYLAGSTLSQTAVVKVNADGTSAWTAEFPSGGAHAMALGNTLDSAGNPSVYTTVLNFLTTRIDQGTTTAPSADLGVTLVDAPDPVRLNADVVYTATVRNTGPSAATAVALDALLPSGLALRGITATQGRCMGTTAIACSLGNLASGAQATVTIRARARTVGPKVTQASVRAAEADPASANNSASQTTTVVRR